MPVSDLKVDPCCQYRISNINSERMMNSKFLASIEKIENEAKSFLSAINLTKECISKCLSNLEGLDGAKINSTLSRIEKTLNDLDKRVAALENNKGAATKTSAPEKEDFDLFGSDDEKEPVRETKVTKAAPAAKGKPKKEVIGRSIIVLDVKPIGSDTDMAELERLVRNVTMDSLQWGTSQLQPVAFGIKKLCISCKIEDEKVSTDDLEAEIMKFDELVQSVDIVSFNKAE